MATDEEDTGRDRETERTEPAATDAESAGREKDDKGSGGSHPDSASWPPIT